VKNHPVSAFIFSVLLLSAVTASAAGILIEAITYDIDSSATNMETVNIKMNSLQNPVIFGVQDEDPPRVVCDFLNAEPLDFLENVTEVGGRFIQRIRMGVHVVPEAKTRIVLDLNAAYNYTIQQIASPEDNRFSIIVKSTDSVPSASKGQ
jgi:hypothetical protein